MTPGSASDSQQDHISNSAATDRSHPWWRPHKWGRWINAKLTETTAIGKKTSEPIQYRDCLTCGRRETRGV